MIKDYGLLFDINWMYFLKYMEIVLNKNVCVNIWLKKEIEFDD